MIKGMKFMFQHMKVGKHILNKLEIQFLFFFSIIVFKKLVVSDIFIWQIDVEIV